MDWPSGPNPCYWCGRPTETPYQRDCRACYHIKETAYAECRGIGLHLTRDEVIGKVRERLREAGRID